MGCGRGEGGGDTWLPLWGSWQRVALTERAPLKRGFTKGALRPPLELDYIKPSPSRTDKPTITARYIYGRGQGEGCTHPDRAGKRDQGVNTAKPRESRLKSRRAKPRGIFLARPATDGFYCPARARAGRRDGGVPYKILPRWRGGAQKERGERLLSSFAAVGRGQIWSGSRGTSLPLPCPAGTATMDFFRHRPFR